MADLVERLRKLSDDCMEDGYEDQGIGLHDAADELDRLRAEVASLKEENARLEGMPFASEAVRAVVYGEAIDRLNIQIAGYISEITDLTQQLADTQQKLAAANERVVGLSNALSALVDHAFECEKQLDEFHGLGVDAGSGCSVVICNARAALSDLPEADKVKS